MLLLSVIVATSVCNVLFSTFVGEEWERCFDRCMMCAVGAICMHVSNI